MEKASISDEKYTPPKMWVEKYKPAGFNKIVGQAGAASCANKLMTWMKNWEKYQSCPKDQRPKPVWTGKGLADPTGASFRKLFKNIEFLLKHFYFSLAVGLESFFNS